MKLFKIITDDEIKYIDLEKVAKIKIKKYIKNESNIFEIRFYSFQNYESIAHADISEEEFNKLSKILESDVIMECKSKEGTISLSAVNFSI
ncbi:hypothetical protein [Methanococcus maripaludis]|uniref:Uncharacterized protein n=1 Tax=Methanococcus maripaludis (strain DSM 14266 / JCM 13030 / NBRC 101832 / S2 / LL) TaxID=267377 RepID=Q6LZ65_METMP|nr:hypothetical protein [Methanococcus maripaludis]CAF30320.1 hypothetical protein MMP0764 [Methanococcus maripaludis S2]